MTYYSEAVRARLPYRDSAIGYLDYLREHGAFLTCICGNDLYIETERICPFCGAHWREKEIEND